MKKVIKKTIPYVQALTALHRQYGVSVTQTPRHCITRTEQVKMFLPELPTKDSSVEGIMKKLVNAGFLGENGTGNQAIVTQALAKLGAESIFEPDTFKKARYDALKSLVLYADTDDTGKMVKVWENERWVTNHCFYDVYRKENGKFVKHIGTWMAQGPSRKLYYLPA